MSDPTRRAFLQSSLGGIAALKIMGPHAVFAATSSDKLAILGGPPVRKKDFPGWPIIETNDRTAWSAVLETGEWLPPGRAPRRLCEPLRGAVRSAYRRKTMSGHVQRNYGFGNLAERCRYRSGDEVIVPPYTFVATINAVFLQHALPVFVDTDRKTFQIDAAKIEAAITPQTRCILPVHLGGNPADVDTILAIAKKHNLRVVEDACQAHLAEWRGKKVGTLGDLGCFSFQASKI